MENKKLENDIHIKIDNCKDLESLFNIWKDSHINHKLYKYDTPDLNGKLVKINSFIEDGFCVTDKKCKICITFFKFYAYLFKMYIILLP